VIEEPASKESSGQAPGLIPTDQAQYLTHVVKSLRGREASTKAKLQNEGWEFVSQTQGKLRTEMTFRRPKPKSVGAYLHRGWVAFRGLSTKAQRTVTAGLAGLVLLVVVLSVIASQGGNAPAATATPSVAAVEPSEASSPVPSHEASPTSTDEPTEDPTNDPTDEAEPEPAGTGEILTTKNNKEFAALLKTTDTCGDSVQNFASKYEDRTIEFDGSISAINNHNSYKTRYDIMISPGNKGSISTRGPNFQFRDVNMLNLNLSGNAPDYVGLDDKLHVVATVDRFPSNQCLLLIEPVSTRVR